MRPVVEFIAADCGIDVTGVRKRVIIAPAAVKIGCTGAVAYIILFAFVTYPADSVRRDEFLAEYTARREEDVKDVHNAP